MISNLQLLQCAYQRLNDPQMNVSFKSELLSISSQKPQPEKNNICPSRRTPRENALAKLLFPGKKITFFDCLRIRNIRICTVTSAVSKCDDDSTVVFKTTQDFSMGRIQSIFSIDDTNDVYLLIDHPTVFDYFDCEVNNHNRFRHSSIQSCLKKNFSTRLIEPSNIVEKCAYYECPNGKCEFMRFPNLDHCS